MGFSLLSSHARSHRPGRIRRTSASVTASMVSLARTRRFANLPRRCGPTSTDDTPNSAARARFLTLSSKNAVVLDRSPPCHYLFEGGAFGLAHVTHGVRAEDAVELAVEAGRRVPLRLFGQLVTRTFGAGDRRFEARRGRPGSREALPRVAAGVRPVVLLVEVEAQTRGANAGSDCTFGSAATTSARRVADATPRRDTISRRRGRDMPPRTRFRWRTGSRPSLRRKREDPRSASAWSEPPLGTRGAFSADPRRFTRERAVPHRTGWAAPWMSNDARREGADTRR